MGNTGLHGIGSRVIGDYRNINLQHPSASRQEILDAFWHVWCVDSSRSSRTWLPEITSTKHPVDIQWNAADIVICVAPVPTTIERNTLLQRRCVYLDTSFGSHQADIHFQDSSSIGVQVHISSTIDSSLGSMPRACKVTELYLPISVGNCGSGRVDVFKLTTRR